MIHSNKQNTNWMNIIVFKYKFIPTEWKILHSNETIQQLHDKILHFSENKIYQFDKPKLHSNENYQIVATNDMPYFSHLQWNTILLPQGDI